MKRTLLIKFAAISILPSLLLTGCNNTSKIQLLKSDMIDSFVYLSSDEFVQRIDRKEDLMVFVYAIGCSACKIFEEYIVNYVNEYHTIIYGIDYTSYSKIQNTSTSFPSIGGTPSIFFYKSGELKYKQNGFTSYKDTKKLISDYCNITTNIYVLNDFRKSEFSDSLENKITYYIYDYLSTKNLDAFIRNNSKANVFYTWDLCSDCTSIINDFMYTNEELNKDYNKYIFKTNYYRESYSSSLSHNDDYYSLWVNFSTKYGFSSFKNGKVPSIVRYENNQATKFEVYSNEGEAELNGNNKYYYPSAHSEEVRSLEANTIDELKELATKVELRLISNLLENM